MPCAERRTTVTEIRHRHTPVMLIHGEKDELIPIHHSEKLCSAFRSAQLVRVDGAGHSDVHQFPSMRKALLSALGRL